MSVAPPEPIEFTLDAAELQRIRPTQPRTTGKLTMPLLAASLVFQIMNVLYMSYREHEHSVEIWVLFFCCAVLLLLVGASALARMPRFNGTSRPGFPTRVTFDDDTLSIEGGGRARAVRSTRIEDVRSVATTADAVVISKNVWPLVVIPRRALADRGEHLMRYFENRLVGKRLLHRPATVPTTIVNSLSK